MNLPSTELVSVLYKLLPGLLAASVFHALTPYPKRDVFDRVVAALIFTLFAQLAVALVHLIAIWIGAHIVSIGTWNTNVELGWGARFGVAMGLLWSHAINNGLTHDLLRKRGTTKKSSLPTQWFSALARYENFLILNLKDERRIMGWAREWPDEPESGHFVLEWASWILPDGSEAMMSQAVAIVICGKDVEFIEFLRDKSDPVLVERAEEIEAARLALCRLQMEASNDQSPKPPSH